MKKKAPQKFFPGDKVRFATTYMYADEVQVGDKKFPVGSEWEVLDHSEWQQQWNEQEKPHVIINYLANKGDLGFQWVDEDCLEFAIPPVTDEEVEEALKSIAASVKTSR